uniref:Ciliary neurotrophic factor n=1 Tax=Nothobranchius furzeri TaxID=105023 RepID=A0A8C6MBS2_NOTFU
MTRTERQFMTLKVPCLFQMTVWWIVSILCCVVLHVESAPTPFNQRQMYKNSFHLTRSTRASVQHLLRNYKEEQMGNVHFEDRSRHLRELPSLSTDFYSWLSLSDRDRLHGAFRDMQVYWNMLEKKRKQLEREQMELNTVHATQHSLIQHFRHIQLDLRDLMSQVSSQVSAVLLSPDNIRACPHKGSDTKSGSVKTLWDSRVEGYIVLRDLDLYLTKLARDFLLLASKPLS